MNILVVIHRPLAHRILSFLSCNSSCMVQILLPRHVGVPFLTAVITLHFTCAVQEHVKRGILTIPISPLVLNSGVYPRCHDRS